MKTFDNGYEEGGEKKKISRKKNSGAKNVQRYVASLSNEQLSAKMQGHVQSSVNRKEDETGRAIYRSLLNNGQVKVQAKLEISHPNDRSETQADDFAQHVVQGNTDQSKNTLQKNGTDINTKSEGSGLSTTDTFDSQLQNTKGQGSKLDTSTKTELEQHTGTDLSGVNIHNTSKAGDLSESINAKAFTHGQDIYFKQGNYNPGSSDGKNLLAHEVAHTVQQGGGVHMKVQRQYDLDSEKKKAMDFFKDLKSNAQDRDAKKRYDEIMDEVLNELETQSGSDTPFYFHSSNLRFFLKRHETVPTDIYGLSLRDPAIFNLSVETGVGEEYEKISTGLKSGTSKIQAGHLNDEVETLTEPTGYTEATVETIGKTTKRAILQQMNTEELSRLINENTDINDATVEKAQIEIVDEVLFDKVEAPSKFEKYMEMRKHLTGIIVNTDIDARIMTELDTWSWQELFNKLFEWSVVPAKVDEHIKIDSYINSKILKNPDRATFMGLQSIVPANEDQKATVLQKQKMLVGGTTDGKGGLQGKVAGTEMGTNPDIEKLLRSITIFLDPGHGYIPVKGTTDKKDTEALYTMEMSLEVQSQLQTMLYNPVKLTHTNDPKTEEAALISLHKDMALARQGKHELSSKVRQEPKRLDNAYTFVKRITQPELDALNVNKTPEQWESSTEMQMGHLTDRANLYGNYFISIHYNAPGAKTPPGTSKGQIVFYEKANESTVESQKLANSIVASQNIIRPNYTKADSYFVTKNFLGTAAVLIEVCFMDNSGDMALVGVDSKTKIKGKRFVEEATQIAQGIANYVSQRKVE